MENLEEEEDSADLGTRVQKDYTMVWSAWSEKEYSKALTNSSQIRKTGKLFCFTILW